MKALVKKLPVKKQTIDYKNGNAKCEEIAYFKIMPPPPGCCQECGIQHDPKLPHNVAQLHYQYTFYARERRWPSWVDAMAHCTDQVRDAWTQELVKHGVDIN